jgi:Xaa-Pro aminopeptidase
MAMQDFGCSFEKGKLHHAREKAREITYELASLIRPGMKEEDAFRMYKDLCQKYGAEKQWHPAKLRFGPNTLLNFKDESQPYVLGDEDIFFIDIGPVFEGHEADYGETFTVGSQFAHKHIADCAKKVFREVGEHWLKFRNSGPELYEYAKRRAEHYGYELNIGMDGHRIGDFPHHVHFKGALLECEEMVIPDAWILEIHLYDPKRRFGAFYEDILTDKNF